jgi:hypothetical protein
MFLIKVEIINGNHEHREWGLVEANDMAEAEKIAQSQVEYDNQSREIDDNKRYWTYGDGELEVRLRSVEPITDEDAQVLKKHGIAYQIGK